jgi:hypothetical protein
MNATTFKDKLTLQDYVMEQGLLSATELALYVAVLKFQDKEKTFAITPYRELQRLSGIANGKTLKDTLLELQAKHLIEVKLGSCFKSNKLATETMAYTLDDLKAFTRKGDSIAGQFATKLQAQTFRHYTNPTWSVTHTGRLTSSKPNFQGEKPDERLSIIQKEIQEGESLGTFDIIQAEPTFIKCLLGLSLETDLYNLFAKGAGVSRDKAKGPINMLAYCRNSEQVFAHFPAAVKQIEPIKEYAEKLHAFKIQLKAQFQKTKEVKTITGRAIEKGTSQRVHTGTVLCWHVQGSIADLINEAGLKLLTENKARLIMPVHDSLICIVKSTDRHLPIEMIKAAYRKNSLPEPRLKVVEKEGKGAHLKELGG